MNTEHLEKAQKIYGFEMDFTLNGNKLMVATDGFITDDPSEITAKKRFGEYRGFYYQYTKKFYISGIIRVIQAISEAVIA